MSVAAASFGSKRIASFVSRSASQPAGSASIARIANRQLSMSAAMKSNYLFKNALESRFPHPMAPTRPSNPNLWESQRSLPRLPIPTLEETAEKYIRSVEPYFETKKEFQAHANLVLEFIKSPLAQKLQKRLHDRDASPETKATSWIYDWWNEFAYMGYRDPVVVYVSYFFAFNDVVGNLPLEPAVRAATLTRGALAFKDFVYSEKLPVETARGKPMSMDQFQWLFNTCRIPATPNDITFVGDNSARFVSDHVIVIRKNKIFLLETTNADKSDRLSTADLELAFKEIYSITENVKSDLKGAIGTLTGDNRDSWTKNRSQLIDLDPKNKENLSIIESAAFVVCLDESSPETVDELSRQCWVGNGTNRFYDKALQFIVFDNGKSGILGEHSMMEATPPSYMCNWLLSQIEKGTFDNGKPKGIDVQKQIKPLNFVVDNDLNSKIKQVKQNFDELTGKHKLRVQVFSEFGKNAIKKWKCSPDSFAQMVIQLAHYRVHGAVKPTYESATVRRFAFGRTETCRSVSVESKRFVQAFDDASVSNEEKVAAFRKATASQTKYMGDCVDGRGVDRHFLGLKHVLKKEEENEAKLFKDEMFNFSKHWVLSTSQISSEHFSGYGWGEVVPNGYGIAYMVNANRLQFNVVSLESMKPDEMREALGKAAHDLGFLLENETKSKL